jgi:hypothetical protein
MTTFDITGKYYSTLLEADIPAEFPEEERGLVQGTWEIILSDDARFQGFKDGEFMVEGRYTATQNQVVFTDEGGLGSEPSAAPGTYEWRADGQTLTLTLVDDELVGRSLVLAAHPLTKQT